MFDRVNNILTENTLYKKLLQIQMNYYNKKDTIILNNCN